MNTKVEDKNSEMFPTADLARKRTIALNFKSMGFKGLGDPPARNLSSLNSYWSEEPA